jgi:hypothetical protein
MDFADLIDVQTTIREFKEEWKLRFTPNDLKFWAPRLESEYPTEQICASMLLEAWGCEEVFTEYKSWLTTRADRQYYKDKYERAKKVGAYSYSLARRDYEEAMMTWPEYLTRDSKPCYIHDYDDDH